MPELARAVYEAAAAMAPSLPGLLTISLLVSFALLAVPRIDRQRIFSIWILIVAAFAAWLAAHYGLGAWTSPVAWALAQAAMIGLGASLFHVLFVRLGLSVIVVEGVASLSYLVVAVRTLAQLGVNLQGLLATSAVCTALIMLAMQDALLNFFGGLVLTLEGNLKKGLWIHVDKYAGSVVQVRARYTAIETADDELVYVPNSVLVKNPLKATPHAWRHTLHFTMPYANSPSAVVRAVEESLAGEPLKGVADNPSPRCHVAEFGPDYVKYGIKLWLTTPGHTSGQCSRVLTRIYFALERSGMRPAGIPQSMEISRAASATVASDSIPERITALRKIDFLHSVTNEELGAIAGLLKPLRFGPGERVVQQGDAGDSMFFVTSGAVQVEITAESGKREIVASLEAGSYFGEMSLLTGAPRSASVRASQQTDCLLLDSKHFAAIVANRPELMDEISSVLAARRAGLDAAHEQLRLSAGARESGSALLKAMQNFFGLLRADPPLAQRAAR